MNEISEIERKVDLLTRGMKIPPKKTRRRVATIVASVLIAMTLIASASLMTTYYHEQNADVNVRSAIIITDPLGEEHETPWTETVTIGSELYPFHGGNTYIYPPDIPPDPDIFYTITNHASTTETVYIHIDTTEELIGGGVGDGVGLDVDVWDVTDPDPLQHYKINTDGEGQILLLLGESVNFEIHLEADPLIDASSTYGYTITMDWKIPE